MQTVILCGGKGTRAYPHTETLPKPLLEVAGRPILRHVMDIFAAQGYQDFVLATGYLGDQIEKYAADLPRAWDVTVVDTGEETNTGARLSRCKEYVGKRFLATYGDGLANVQLEELIAFHSEHQGRATLSTVPLPSQYGTVEASGDGRVYQFREKPILDGYWINAGFFVFDRDAFDHWVGEDLEREVLPALAAAGQLYAYRHQGFFGSMDTYKDALRLSDLCGEGTPPWLQLGEHLRMPSP
jgi:glucose-1-phosphate cytidylyltransferase